MKLPGRALIPWVLVVLASIAAVTFGVLWFQERSKDDAESELRAAATEFVTALTNFSADSIEEDAEDIRSFAVGSFAEEADTFFGDRAIEAIQEAEATSEGEIESLFIQSLGDDSGAVFVVVNQSVTNAGLNEAKTDLVRMEVGMVDTDSGWKVDRVDVLQSPGTVVPGADASG